MKIRKNNFTVRIGNYTWSIEFASREELNGYDGRTFPNDFKILIRNDLNMISTRLVYIHEIVHALFDTQGRCYQKKFDVEEVCEFIAFRFNEMSGIIDVYDQNVRCTNED